MLELTGKLVNVFKIDDWKNPKTGEVRPGGHKIQLLCENVLRNGEGKRMEMITLSVKNAKPFMDYIGQDIRVKVGAFVSGKAVQFYMTDEDFDVL
jgi:hypothetical protein